MNWAKKTGQHVIGHGYCNYLIGLGYLGLGAKGKAKDLFTRVLNANPYHTGSWLHLTFCP